MKFLMSAMLVVFCGFGVAAVASESSSSMLYVKASNLNVRDSPDGRIVGTLKRGAAVTFVAKQDRWVLITDDVLGDKWVAVEHLCSGDGCWAK